MTAVVLPRRRRTAIPLADTAALRGPARRTAALRLVLALGLIGLTLAALLVSRDLRPRPSTYLASGSGVVVLDLSTSVDPQRYRRLARVLRTLVETNQRLGLVVYSDAGYAMLPLAHAAPGTALRVEIPGAGERNATVVALPFMDAGKEIPKG